MKRRSVAAARITLLIGTAASFAAREPSLAGMKAPARAATSCGVKRWTVKTLQDKPSLHAIQTGTIAQLITVPKPDPLPGTRAPFEFNQFRVTARVTKIIGEADGDLHLVISDGSHTLITESPVLACASGATSYRQAQMRSAHAAVRLCDSAELVGVAFFDFFHHQTGVAPNEIELHPLLAFKCLS